jgi:hypothetical protein
VRGTTGYKRRKPEDIYKSIGQKLKADGKAKAKERAKSLFGDPPPGYKTLPKDDFLNLARRNWSDQAYREGLLTRVGVENFRDIVIELYGGDESVWPLPEGGPANG